ncbi:hypothetical protein DID78_01440 [Candidatus Marinamargulisbacteria bacterium SCGC AG-343-D04]|nr:hypothetical protein DID78_01440 [Candidatus Marinamargulisbacteria bacterium SCGC AG-343-D04]
MRLTFRYLLYLVLLIGFVTLAFTFFSKQVVHPMFEKKPDFQEDIVFQKTQEAHIKANVERLLEKLIGKKTFVVSVVANLNSKDVKEYVLEHEPKIVSSNEMIGQQSQLARESVSYAHFRPKVQDIKEEISDLSASPGFDFQSVATTVIDLPGFPSYLRDDKALSSDLDTDSPPVSMEQSRSELAPQYSMNYSNQSEKTSDHVIYNKKTIETTIPRKRLEHVLVSVVIDEDYFGYLDLKKEDMEGLILTASGINVQRGDQLTVSFAPFLDKAFSWAHFFKKNKVWFDKILKFYEKIKPVLFMAFVALLGAVAVYGVKKGYLLYDKRRQRLLSDKLRQLEEKNLQEKEDKVTELEEKKQAILQLAQTQPEQFNMLLNSWVELDAAKVE